MLKLSDFDYQLPKELIAQYPLEKRDEARLLVLERKSGRIDHLIFKDIAGLFKENDLLVLNDTKVLNCRLAGKKVTGGKVEILLTARLNGTTFSCLVQPSRTKIKEEIFFADGKVKSVLVTKGKIAFKKSDADRIYDFGVVPLPPYIKRKPQAADLADYQTVYAKNEGALASPTAGLHFTKNLLEELQKQAVKTAYLTLHVGLGTFRPVRCEDIKKHKMDPEYFQINPLAERMINQAKDNGRIIAVGTTSMRTLETYAASGKQEGNTDLFIFPGFEFKLTDMLLTNFHFPRTTLFMLVCAFAGRDLAMQAYREAIEKRYRFYSYGDAMLII